MRFSIGEFSRMTALSIKALRLYHEKEILIPDEVDESTGYRYYSETNYNSARSIRILKELRFTLAEIKEILAECSDETDMLTYLQDKLGDVRREINRYRAISRSIELILQAEKERPMNKEHAFEIEEKEVETLLIAGHRMKGRYGDVGKGFKLLGKALGRNINGKPMTLYYDAEYKEDDADFEACFPVRKGKDAEGVSVRELKGGKCVSLIHAGPYETIGESYKKVFAYINEKGYTPQVPTREVYLKGPGMIFKGNPNNYLTEIIVIIEG